MTMTLSGSNGITFNDASTQHTGKQACKAWVNFYGIGTATVNNSYNISSITRNATGDYTINFTTAMANANYAVAFGGTSGYDAAYATMGFYSGGGNSQTAPSTMTTTALRFVTAGKYGTSASMDMYTATVSVFGS